MIKIWFGKKCALDSRRKEKAQRPFQGRGPATKLCLHHMKNLCAPLVLRGRGFGNRPTSRRGETAAGGPQDRRVGYERTPGGSFLVGAISQKVFGILI